MHEAGKIEAARKHKASGGGGYNFFHVSGGFALLVYFLDAVV